LAGGSARRGAVALALVEGLVCTSDLAVNVQHVTFVSVRQVPTPDRLQERVGATVRVLTTGLVPLGAFAGGQLGTAIGLRGTVLVGAAGVLLAFLWVALSPVRSLRALPSETTAGAPSPEDEASETVAVPGAGAARPASQRT
jgi:hypothetical protein